MFFLILLCLGLWQLELWHVLLQEVVDVAAVIALGLLLLLFSFALGWIGSDELRVLSEHSDELGEEEVVDLSALLGLRVVYAWVLLRDLDEDFGALLDHVVAKLV